MRFILRIVAGEGLGAEFEASEGRRVVVGRAADADVKLLIGEVSRRHCEFACEGGALTVRDAGSRGGTYVNGARVAEYVLSRGDTVKVGPVVFEVVTPDQSPAPPAPPVGHDVTVAEGAATPPPSPVRRDPPPGFPAPASREADLLFGRIAVGRGLVSEADLERAIAAQEEDRRRGAPACIGAVLASLGLISAEQVEAVAAVQRYANNREDQRQFGMLAVRNGFLTEARLEEVLEEQKTRFARTGSVAPVGELLVEHGLLTPQKVRALLVQQERLKARKAEAGAGAAGQAPTPPSGGRRPVSGPLRPLAHGRGPSSAALPRTPAPEPEPGPPPDAAIPSVPAPAVGALPDAPPAPSPAPAEPGLSESGPAPRAPPPAQPEVEEAGDTLFGRVALSRGFITQEQLETLLAAQQQDQPPGEQKTLGDLARELGLLSDEQVAAVIAEQDRREAAAAARPAGLAAPDGAPAPSKPSGDPTRFGTLAVRNRFATEAQVEECVAFQETLRSHGDSRTPRIGELLIERGYLKKQEVFAVLRHQQRVRHGRRPPRGGSARLAPVGPVAAAERAGPPPIIIAGGVLAVTLVVVLALLLWPGKGGDVSPRPAPTATLAVEPPPSSAPAPPGGGGESAARSPANDDNWWNQPSQVKRTWDPDAKLARKPAKPDRPSDPTPAPASDPDAPVFEPEPGGAPIAGPAPAP
ncbi:MAG: FHA domain-containing protein, partial [Planctomycetes bacterium]|nr:FHA domain-containing protein [Planctomycetota bacterium]